MLNATKWTAKEDLAINVKYIRFSEEYKRVNVFWFDCFLFSVKNEEKKLFVFVLNGLRRGEYHLGEIYAENQ